MSNIKECKYFLIIKKQKILFKIFDPINGSYLIKEIFVENYFPNDTYNLLEKFLEKNIQFKFNQITNDNPTSTIFYLKTKGKKRGYIEQQILEHKGGIESKLIEWKPVEKKQ